MRSYQLHPDADTAHHKRWTIFAIFLIIVTGLITVWITLPHHNDQKDGLAPITNKATAAKPTPTSIESKLLFAGDIYWGRSMTKWAQASELKSAYPFSGLEGFKKDSYDAWIGNLECPTVPGVTPTEREEKVLLMFNCSTEYLPEFAKWFDIVSLANNHTDNQQPAGFAATRTQLDTQHMQYFGHYDPSVANEVCEVVSMPVQVKLSSDHTEAGSLPFALCGYHGVFKIPPDASLAVMQKYAQYMPVIAMPHMGTEYKPAADSLRETVYRKMIDNGADAVLGGHPHWVQNSESYKGKLIVYSLGNFIFDQQFEPDVMRGAVMTLDLSLSKNFDQKQLSAWLKLSPSCKQFADSCLAEAEKQGLQRLPLEFKWSMLASDSSNKLTKPANPDLTAAIADRLNWNQTAAQLQPAGKPYPN